MNNKIIPKFDYDNILHTSNSKTTKNKFVGHRVNIKMPMYKDNEYYNPNDLHCAMRLRSIPFNSDHVYYIQMSNEHWFNPDITRFQSFYDLVTWWLNEIYELTGLKVEFAENVFVENESLLQVKIDCKNYENQTDVFTAFQLIRFICSAFNSDIIHYYYFCINNELDKINEISKWDLLLLLHYLKPNRSTVYLYTSSYTKAKTNNLSSVSTDIINDNFLFSNFNDFLFTTKSYKEIDKFNKEGIYWKNYLGIKYYQNHPIYSMKAGDISTINKFKKLRKEVEEAIEILDFKKAAQLTNYKQYLK